MSRNYTFAAPIIITCIALVLVACGMWVGQAPLHRNGPSPSSTYLPGNKQAPTRELHEPTDVTSRVRTITQTPFVDPVHPTLTQSVPTLSLPSHPTVIAPNTLDVLMDADVPQSDLREIAMRVRGIPDIPLIVGASQENYQIDDILEFSATNLDSDENFNLTARLVYQTPLVYFFAEQGMNVDDGRVRTLVADFEQNTYRIVREFFGSEWTPGVDGDPHIYILYTTGLGSSVAGYYSSADEYSRLAHEFSNEKEMFYINANVVGLDDPELPGILAHELQHMVHWANDPNEDTWMNEGASVLAEFLTENSLRGFDHSFILNPDLQLNTWSETGGGVDSIPHYGASFLFLTYFLDRFGNEATRGLVSHEMNGMQAVGSVLQEMGVTDPLTSSPIDSEDVFADWVVANYLGDRDWSDGRYVYHNYESAPKVEIPMENIYSCPFEILHGVVHQYAADYISIDCEGTYTLSFAGIRQVRVVPAEAHSGRYVFWSNRQDASDTRLTREFDLSSVDSATLNYWAWWSIENNYDYVYVEVSTDDGDSWHMLETPSGTDVNPSGNNLGWGYHYNSGGEEMPQWVHESVDLTPYAGSVVHVRFEYVTDAAINRPGMLLDDISVPEIGYTEDFEEGRGRWEGHGWVRFDNVLPQTWLVQIVGEDERS